MDARKLRDSALDLTAKAQEHRRAEPARTASQAVPLRPDFAAVMRRVEAEVYDAA